MNAESLFRICNLVALIGWVILAVFPRRRWSAPLVTSILIPALLSSVYLVLIAARFGKGEGDFQSLAGVSALFADPYVLLAGWVHYLAFDLFVGSFEVRDAQRLGISHFVVLPCLFFTFMLGPIGFLSYLVVRSVKTRRLALD
jgi:Domain of unknown function (DUF4281)